MIYFMKGIDMKIKNKDDNVENVIIYEILNSSNLIIKNGYNISLANQYLILGELVYDVLISHILFSDISQNIQTIGTIINHISERFILSNYIHTLFPTLKIWESTSYGIKEKIRISYKVLGYCFHHKGYNSVYTNFRECCSDYLIKKAYFPLIDYEKAVTQLLGTPRFKVLCINDYSEKDKDYKAVTTFKGMTFANVDSSKSQAVNGIYKLIADKMLTNEQIKVYSEEGIKKLSVFSPIEENNYFPDVIDNLSQELGIEPSFLQFSLLSKKLSNNSSWDYLGIPVPEYFQQSINASFNTENRKFSVNSRYKHSLINFGKIIIRLLSFYYNFKSGYFNKINLSVFDCTLEGISSHEKKLYIDQVLNVEHLGESLYCAIEHYYNRDYSKKEKYQVICSLFAACFLSNYDPINTLSNFFDAQFTKLYSNEININKHYKIELSDYLISINSRPESILEEIGDNKYRAKLKLDKNSNSPVIIATGESTIIKKEIWEIGYKKIVEGTVDALTNPKSTINKECFSFVINKFCNISNLSLECPLRSIGIIDAKNYAKIQSTDYLLILSNIKSYLSDLEYSFFVQRIKQFNEPYYICFEDRIYKFNQALERNFDYNSLSSVAITHESITNLYRFIVNPSFVIQRKYIERNIQNIQNIPAPSFQLAKYIIDKNIDNYKYILYPSNEVEEYYQNKCRQAESLTSDKMGQLLFSSSDNTEMIILDSHKSVSIQIEELIDDMNITEAIIACGYMYRSGISLMKKSFDRFKESHIPVKLIIGSLQNFRSESDSLLTGIDKATVRELQVLMENGNFDIYTCEERFYHGKIFLFKSDEKTVICFGSSNLSKSAFINNYELNMALISSHASNVVQMFQKWIDQLIFYSTKIEFLDENKFCENEINHESSSLIRHVSKAQIRKQIEELSDEEVKIRLQLWMSYNPDIVTTDLGILSLPNYYGFIYNSRKLLVLESFISGNSYFCISYSDNFETELKNISSLTKTEIYEHSHMDKRGYHTRNRFTLEKNIRSYFK